jgi:hypothetical protein
MMKKLIAICIAIIGIIICSLFIMFDLGFRFILKNNGIEFKIPETQEEIVDSYLSGKYITIREDSSTKGFDYEDAGVTVLVTGVEYGRFLCDMRSLSVNRYLPETSKLIQYIKDTRTEYTDAVLELDKEYNLIAVGGSNSTEVDLDSVYNYVNEKVKAGFDVDITLKDFYINQNETTVSRNIEESIKKYNEFKIVYTNGFVLDSKVLAKRKLISINDDGTYNIEVEESDCRDIAGRNLTGYNNIGVNRNFRTHDGRDIIVKSETFGNYIDYKEEGKYMLDAIKNFKSEEDRYPILKQKEEFPLDKTYIELDKQNQKFYYYVDNELVLESNIVTGLPTKQRDTPTGIYFIINKAREANLVGETWDVEVDYWLGVTYTGVGFHDASWRNKFGGTIWKNNGSHGCINTPYDAMKELYETVDIGTAVVIY